MTVYTEIGRSPVMATIFRIVYPSVRYFTPFLVALTLNLLILRELRKASKQRSQLTNQDSQPVDTTAEDNVTKITIAVSSIFFVMTSCNIALAISQFLAGGVMLSMNFTFSLILTTAELCGSLGFTTNFFIYSACSGRFRKSFKEMFGKMCKKHSAKPK